jgi:predicted NodU family carbamoyl transferase
MPREFLRYNTMSIDDIFKVDKFRLASGFRDDAEIFFYNHHESHPLAPLFHIDWNDALLVAADAGGDTVNYSHRHFAKGALKTIYGGEECLLTPLPIDRIAYSYMTMTAALGFIPLRDEGKLTGLAAYGEPILADQIAGRFFVNESDPAMGDEGMPAAGALCYLLQRDGLSHWLSQRHRLRDVYFGRDYTNLIDDAMAASPNIRRTNENSIAGTARRLNAGLLGAIYVGRMEYGPRALGARSILANPSRRETHDLLNKRFSRSEFMPFAPVIAADKAATVFDVNLLNAYACRFMTITCNVRPEWRGRIAAVVHIDGSARPQIIEREPNPLYYDILTDVRAREWTSCPGQHEEPIVNKPAESSGRSLAKKPNVHDVAISL